MRRGETFLKYGTLASSLVMAVLGISVSTQSASAACTGTDVLYKCIDPTTTCSGYGMVADPACSSTCNGGWTYCVSQAPGSTGAGASTGAIGGASTSGGSAASGTGAGSGGGGAACSEPGYERIAGVCFPTETGLPDPEGGILAILSNFFGWLFLVFGFLAVGAFIISGIQYVTAAGSDDQIKTAKRNMMWSIVGVVVGLSGYVILMAVANALNAIPAF